MTRSSTDNDASARGAVYIPGTAVSPQTKTPVPSGHVKPSPPGTSTDAEGAATAQEAARRVPGSLLVTTRDKLGLSTAARKLRDEQISARVVYFEPDARTNADLDRITEGVIAELHAIQDAGEAQRPRGKDVAEIEIELIALLRTSLEPLVDPHRGNFLRLRLLGLSRWITTLFFESAIARGDGDTAGSGSAVATPEQAVYRAVARQHGAIVDGLKAMRYETPAVRDAALERFARVERELQTDLLTCTAPELERLLAAFLDVVGAFFQERFRPNLGEFAWAVVRGSGVARTATTGAHVPERAFNRFREVFEKQFLDELVLYAQEPLLARLSETPEIFRPETVAFVESPKVFSAVCSVMCDGFYDHLRSEGMLDLPTGWRSIRETV